MMLKGAGFEVVDLGVDVDPEKFVDQVKAADAHVVGLSALLTTTMPGMEKIDSTITLPPSRAGRSVAISVTRGTSEFTNACKKMTFLSDNPFARAVVIYC